MQKKTFLILIAGVLFILLTIASCDLFQQAIQQRISDFVTDLNNNLVA